VGLARLLPRGDSPKPAFDDIEALARKTFSKHEAREIGAQRKARKAELTD